MTNAPVLLRSGQRWVCPNCPAEGLTLEPNPRVPFHTCPGVAGLQAPLIRAGIRAKVERVEREDYVGHEQVQRDANGRPVMSLVTTRDDGQDVVVFAPTAVGHSGKIPKRYQPGLLNKIWASLRRQEFAHNSWSASKIFSAFITDALNGTAAFDLNSDTLEAALFDNSITPSQTVAAASGAYGAGVWASGGVVDTGTSAPAGWPALGRPLASVTSTFASNVYSLDAADTVSANVVTTLTNVFGILVYDHTLAAPVADQAISFHYLGGAQTVTLGTFTVVWNATTLIVQLTL